MKNTIVACCLLAMMIIFTVTASIYMSKKSAAMVDMANGIMNMCDDEEWEEAAGMLASLSRELESIKLPLSFMEDHQALELLEFALKSAGHFMRDRDAAETNSCLESFVVIMDRLNQHGIPSLKNIM